MPEACLTEPHGPGGGASWAVASSKLLGRGTTTAYLDLPLADMIAARVLLSAWQASILHRVAWMSRRCIVGGCVLKIAWLEHYHSLPIDLPLAHMIAARVLLSAWRSPCQKHS